MKRDKLIFAAILSITFGINSVDATIHRRTLSVSRTNSIFHPIDNVSAVKNHVHVTLTDPTINNKTEKVCQDLAKGGIIKASTTPYNGSANMVYYVDAQGVQVPFELVPENTWGVLSIAQLGVSFQNGQFVLTGN